MRKDMEEEEERRKRARRQPVLVPSSTSNCISWESLPKDWVSLGETRHQKQFEGFVMMNFKLYSVRFDFGKNNSLSLNRVESFDEFEISKILPCEGLLLLVVKDESKLVVWNPYLNQTRSILPRTNFHTRDIYAIGYDISRNHKILRYLEIHGCNNHIFALEIYDFSSSSWRVLEGGPDCVLETYFCGPGRGSLGRGVSVKGNTYFYGHDHQDFSRDPPIMQVELEDFIVCFDFTTETFGPHLPLPIDSKSCEDKTVSLFCLPEDRLAVLYFQTWESNKTPTVEIWISTKIEPKFVSWTHFLKVDVTPLNELGVHFTSFFIDEQSKVVVIFDINSYMFVGRPVYNTAFFFGEAGYYKSSVNLGEALKIGQVGNVYCTPLLSASPYFPSSVQVKQLDQA